MRILIWRHGQRIGPHTVAEINRLLEKGELALDDLAESPETGNWVPLSTIEGINQSQSQTTFEKAPARSDGATILTATITPPKPASSLFAQRAAFGSLVEAITTHIDQFLARSAKHIRPDGAIPTLTNDAFFERWLAEADKFTLRLCHQLAEVLKHSSIRDDIRAYDAQALAVRIRESSFSELDAVLSSFVRVLKELGVSLSHTLETLQAASASEGALQNWLAQEINTGKTAEPVLRADEEIRPGTQKKMLLLHRLHDLRIRSQSLAFSKIVDYLKALERSSAKILDYCGERCFSTTIDLELQASVVASTKGEIEQKTTPIIERMLNAASTEARALEQRKRKEIAKLRAEEDLYTVRTLYQSQGIACMSIGGLCLFPAWIIVLLGFPGTMLRWAALAGGILGLIAFFGGVTRLSMGRCLQVEHFVEPELTVSKPEPEKPAASGDPPSSPASATDSGKLQPSHSGVA